MQKRKNQGFSLIATVAVISVVAAVLLVGLSSYTYKNVGVRYEQQLRTAKASSEVVLNNYTAKVQEVAQVPAMYKSDLQEVIRETFAGRYGNDGSKAVFQFIQERNMNLDPELYRSITQVMISGREEFKFSQSMMVDIRENYRAQTEYVWSGFWLSFVGYPRVDLSDTGEYQTITLDEVSEKFKTGKDSIIKLK